MSKSYKKQTFFAELKYYVLDCLSASKTKIIITSFILFVSLVLGIILAVQYNSDASLNVLKDYGIVKFVGSGVTTTFFSRLLSCILVMLLLFGCSFTPFLTPLAIILLAFRSYLLGFNFCLMLLTYGVSGIIISIFVILPCQVFLILLLTLYFFMLNKNNCDNRCYGGKGGKMKTILCFALILAIVCLIETILLLIFNANVIIVI